MLMSPGLRKLALTAHVASSVGFPGAVACFLALAITGLTSQDAEVVRAAYVAMDVTAWLVILPLGVASLVTGIVSSLGTSWGLFRYYWVLVKLLLTIPSIAILLVHMRPIGLMAAVPAEAMAEGAEMVELQVQLVAASAAGLVVLIVAIALSIYKPRGLTPYGWRKQNAQRSPQQS